MLITPGGGLQDKALHLKEMKDGTMKFTAMDDPEVKVRVNGDAAVVTGRRQSKIRRQGQEAGGTSRFTRVFARRGGGSNVSGQLTPIAAQPGGSGERP
jgi:ketosteroid isomerase-like protein